MKINSHNEWDKLREVIVGNSDGMTIGLEFKKMPSEKLFKEAAKIAKEALPLWYKDEVAEDLEGLCKVFKGFGVKILHPKPFGAENLFSTPHWSASGRDIYNARDLNIVIGNKMIASPSPARTRYFEHDAFYDIWQHYFEDGFEWIVAPKPLLKGKYLLPHLSKNNKDKKEDELHNILGGGLADKKHFKLKEEEILFDAANIIRMGRDILYLISSTGNHKGGLWLKKILGDDYRVHFTTTYRSSHLDSTILPLRPGLVLLNATRVTAEGCPKIFDKWEKIYFSDVVPTPNAEIDFQKNVRSKVYKKLQMLGVESDLNQMSSPWAGLNVLSLDSETVLVQSTQLPLIKKLEKHKLTVIPIEMRHSYTMLGGLHCATLDTVRDGQLEDYFSSKHEKNNKGKDYLKENDKFWTQTYDAPNVESFIFRLYGRILKFEYGMDGSKHEKVLDFGCGQGGALNYFSKLGFDCYGVDISENAIDSSRKNIPKIPKDHFKVIDPKPDENQLFFGGKFDLIISIQTLDFLSNTDFKKAIKCIYNNMKPGAKIYASYNGSKIYFKKYGKYVGDGLYHVKFKTKYDRYEYDTYLNFAKNKEDVKKKFSLFKPIYIDYYDSSFQEQGSEFRYTFFGEKA